MRKITRDKKGTFPFMCTVWCSTHHMKQKALDAIEYITISFGFRNPSYSIANLEGALKDIHRVLKDDGKLVIVKTSQPANALARNIFHVKRVAPYLFGIVSLYIFQKKSDIAE